MPNKHAALKQIRKDEKRRARNQAIQSQLKTMTKRFLALISAKQADQARAYLPQVAKRYDHAAVKGIIHRNTAARFQSRLARRLNQLQSNPSAA